MQIREFQPGWIFRNGTTASWYCLCNGIKFDPKKWPGLKGNIKIIHDPAGQLDGALAASPIQDMDHPTAWLILLDSYPTWLWHSQFAMVITMALIEIDGLPFLIAWWIVPWHTVSHNQRVSVHQQRKSFQSFPWIHHSATTRCPNGERNLNQDSQDHHQRPESCFLASEKSGQSAMNALRLPQ